MGGAVAVKERHLKVAILSEIGGIAYVGLMGAILEDTYRSSVKMWV